ncbi:MAG: PAS domain S-box protein [Candidatus Aminicenantes bacterium RBG_16_66_30]
MEGTGVKTKRAAKGPAREDPACPGIPESSQASAQYARSLIEASLDPFVTISPEGKITDVNEATVKVTGFPRTKLVGTDFSDYFTEPDQARRGYEQVFAKGYVTDYPLTMRHRDGRLASVLYNASVYRDAQGRVLGVFAAARDVTAQRQAAQYARSLIEASLDPLVTISPEGKITDVNEATIKATGVPRDELIGTDFSNYFTEPEDARRGYEQVFAKGYVTDYPLTIRHRDGRLTWVLYNASVYLDAQGAVLGVFAAARDVTAQRKAEAEVAEQRAREEQQARELERLAELERFQKLTVGRELKMIELKKEISELRLEIDKLRKGGPGGLATS